MTNGSSTAPTTTLPTASFTVTTTSVTASTSATISAVFAGVTRTAALTVNPAAPPAPAAPALISPAANATVAQPVTFDWSDVANATSYEIQVDDSSTITAPFRANQIVDVSQATIGGLPAQRLWWRVRARNSAEVWGPFSSTRRFTAQAAPAAATLSSLSVNPTSVVGPASSTGTATLTAAAPTGGAVVTLSSNNTAATVPASVTVPAGATSATFTVTTTSVSTSTSVTLTGTYGGTSRTTTLTVTPQPPPASLNTLTLNPASVTGGNTSQGAALRKALEEFYPNLREMTLLDYKVRILDESAGTAAKTRVLITSGDGDDTWGTVGVAGNIIEASWQALVDSIEYKLRRDERPR